MRSLMSTFFLRIVLHHKNWANSPKYTYYGFDTRAALEKLHRSLLDEFSCKKH